MPNYLASDEPSAPNKEFTIRSAFGDDLASELEAKRPGFLMQLATALSAGIDSRLIKRGDVPFTAPYPEVVKQWVADLLTPRAFQALGVRPTDETQADITEQARRAEAEIREASDPVTGCIVLPIQQGSATIQATEPATSVYSEQSPFTWKHRQMDAVANNRRYG